MERLKEAAYYKVQKNKQILCQLCPHMCRLKDKEMGICGTRMPIDGKLRALSYGKIIAANADPVEKKPLYHFIPGHYTYSIGTAGCNMHCKNCQNASISQEKIDPEGGPTTLPEDIVEDAKTKGFKSISYTYTEPTVFFEYMRDTASLARERGLKNIMVSNGYINPKPLQELIHLIDAANIDMKAFNASVYKELTGARLKPVLKSIERLYASPVHLELTLLLIPGYSDKEKDLDAFFNWMITRGMENVPLHISRFYPTYRLQNVSPTPEKRIFEVREKAMDAGLQYVYPGNISGSDALNTYCPYCGEIAIQRDYRHAENLLDEGLYCNNCGNRILSNA